MGGVAVIGLRSLKGFVGTGPLSLGRRAYRRYAERVDRQTMVFHTESATRARGVPRTLAIDAKVGRPALFPNTSEGTEELRALLIETKQRVRNDKIISAHKAEGQVARDLLRTQLAKNRLCVKIEIAKGKACWRRHVKKHRQTTNWENLVFAIKQNNKRLARQLNKKRKRIRPFKQRYLDKKRPRMS